jgi:nucleolar protein 56
MRSNRRSDRRRIILKGRLFLTEIGVMILDKPMETFVAKRFPESEALQIYRQIESGEMVPWLKTLLSEAVNKDFDIFQIHEEPLLKAAAESGFQVYSLSDHELERMQSRKTALMVQAGWVKNEGEAQSVIRDFALKISNLKIREMAAKPDLQVIQSVQALDEIDRTLNGVEARVREWYGLHFPELDRILDSPESYVNLVAKFGRRDSITKEGLEKLDFPKEKIEKILSTAQKSKGSDLREEDLQRILDLAEEAVRMSGIRDRLNKHVEQTMSQIAPNVNAVAGSTIGARLIAKAGGLDKLARRPASTIQVLGAEKALFRALRTGARPPKHGILFQHQAVHTAPRWQRGKIARSLAAKIAIAARIDFYRGTSEGGLKENLDKRFEEIRAKYSEPPPAPVKPRFEREEREGGRWQGGRKRRWRRQGEAQKGQGRRRR